MRTEVKVEDNLLKHLIAEEYTPESLGKIREVLEAYRTHEIRPVANGLFAASAGVGVDSLTGYQNVWVRDNIMVANSFRLRGQTAIAVECVRGLTRFFENELPRFRDIIEDPTRTLKETVSRRPHIRFTAQTLGEMTESWSHAQNDALGLGLWFRFVLATSGTMPLTVEDSRVFDVFPEYFEVLEYWRDKDSGSWEEQRKINCSSIGAVVAGLEEMLEYKKSACKSSGTPACVTQTAKLESLIAKGRETLDSNLPFETPPERMVDSALLMLVYPLGVVKDRATQDAILNLVQARLKGEVGIRRYVGDSYFCQDYDEWFSPRHMSSNFSERMDFRNAHLRPNCEAQWCIFDPVLSIVYGQRFLADRADAESFQKQVHYFNRSLSQLSADGQCPELYFLKNGRYISNTHTPLAWTQANQALALRLMEQSTGEK
jgi:GH15 family glucan-1,4-alpha-glucosidase